ncbi:MAG: sugar phosphate isomerase/epimerase [Acidobacteria bacterium]|nr:MAG: sugar phosphate isomerase/epimerase [Acidobacteriota bacterium]
MKYGVNTMVWTTRITEQHSALFSGIREWGFDGVELFLSPTEPASIPAVRRILEEVGLERTTCSVLPREANLIDADPQVRARGGAFLKQCIERTAELGGKLICGPLYAALGVMSGRRRTDDEWKRAVEGLHAAAGQARKFGITLCLEPLNRFETYFLNTLSDAAQLVHDVGEPNVLIHFDTFHANIEERHPATSLRAVAKELGHVHISENDRGIPGTGHNDWRGILLALKEIGYEGWMTIESFAQPEPELAAAAAIWRDLASSGDELAREGLRFIKALSQEIDLPTEQPGRAHGVY